MGYCLSKEYWNKGYMTEAIQAVLEFAKDELHIASIYARVAVENMQSVRVLEKLHFQGGGACTYSSYDKKRVFESNEYRI